MKVASDNAETDNQKIHLVFVSMAVAAGPRAAPLGAAQVLAWLYKQPDLRSAFSFQLIECSMADSLDVVLQKILQAKPQIVGLSLYNWNRQRLTDLTTALRKAIAGLTVLAGGPEASGDPEDCLSSRLADYVVQGEGELACAAFLEDYRLGKVPPLEAAAEKRIYRQAIPDLALLPSPWLDGLIKPEDGAVWELTRGCPYQCAFCYESKGSGTRIRAFPEQRLEKELRLFAKQGVQEIFVLDPTFNADSGRMKQLLKLMRRLAPDMFFQFELRAELLTAEQAAWLADINCQVQLGLQSSNPTVLRQVGRSFDATSYAEKIALLEEQGIIYGLDLMFGLPGETLVSFKESLDYALHLRPNHLDIFPLSVLPGTALAETAAELGLCYEEQAPHTILETPQFPPTDLAEAQKLATACELLYNKGRAVMWFLPLCAALECKPVELLAAWLTWLQAAGAAPAAEAAAAAAQSHAHIEQLQLAFLSEYLPKQLSQDHSRLAVDLVRVSGAWTRAIAEGEESRLELEWLPEDLLDLATQDFEELIEFGERKAGRWLCTTGPKGPGFRRL